MLHRVWNTSNDPAPLFARIALAVVIFPHGAQHLLGWFGGYGFGGTMDWMTGTVGFPAPLAALAIITEFVAPIALVVGFGGRVAALGIVGLMLGALSTHAGSGFFMNWFGQLPAGEEGFEFHLIAIALAATVVLAGSGAWSVDRRLTVRPKDAGDGYRRPAGAPVPAMLRSAGGPEGQRVMP